MHALRAVATAALVACALACAGPEGIPYPQFAASAPHIALGRTRLVVYRTLYTPPENFEAQITVDGAAVGTLRMGTWLWVDQPAGLHRVDSPLWPAYSAFGDQLATKPLALELATGTTTFVSVSVDTSGPLRVSFDVVPPDQARSDLATLEMASPSTAASP